MADASTATPEDSRKRHWKQNPEGVQRSIIKAATKIFAEQGFASARVDDVAARTKTSKRMIYYYFGDKRGLYAKVLEAAYDRLRKGEAQVRVDDLSPVEGLERLITFHFDHNRNNPDFIRIMMIENIQNARTLTEAGVAAPHASSARSSLNDIYESGVAQGVFRAGLDPLKIRLMFVAPSSFNVSNRPSFSALMGNRLWEEGEQLALRELLVETIMRLVLTPDALADYLSSKDLARPE